MKDNYRNLLDLLRQKDEQIHCLERVSQSEQLLRFQLKITETCRISKKSKKKIKSFWKKILRCYGQSEKFPDLICDLFKI